MAPPSSPAVRRSLGRAEDGARIAVDLGEDVASAALRSAWPRQGLDLIDGETPADGATDADPIAFATPADLVRVESQLALFAAEHLDRLVAVHATLIAWPDLVVLAPGSSHAGKTTFALAARSHGARIWSDEYALVDPETGRTTGWQRPLHVRGPEGTARLDLAEPGPPVPVDAVAAIRYDPAVGTVFVPMAPADVASALLANAVCARRRPEDTIVAAAAIARTATGIQGTRGEAGDAVAELRDQLLTRRGS